MIAYCIYIKVSLKTGLLKDRKNLLLNVKISVLILCTEKRTEKDIPKMSKKWLYQNDRIINDIF